MREDDGWWGVLVYVGMGHELGMLVHSAPYFRAYGYSPSHVLTMNSRSGTPYTPPPHPFLFREYREIRTFIKSVGGFVI